MFFSFTRELDVEAGYVVSALFSLFFSPSLFSELKKRFSVAQQFHVLVPVAMST